MVLASGRSSVYVLCHFTLDGTMYTLTPYFDSVPRLSLSKPNFHRLSGVFGYPHRVDVASAFVG